LRNAALVFARYLGIGAAVAEVIVASWGFYPVSLQRLLAVVALCLVATLAGRLPAQAPALAQGSQLEISMDELVDDTWNNTVAARGGVEIRYYGEILNADEVSYDRSTGKLVANGNVSLQEVDGKVTHTDHLLLNDELRDAFVAYARRQRIRIDR
jgi:LPS-assembly protein